MTPSVLILLMKTSRIPARSHPHTITPSTPRWTGSATNACGEIAGRGRRVAALPWAKDTELRVGPSSTISRSAGQCQKPRYPETFCVSYNQNLEAKDVSGPVLSHPRTPAMVRRCISVLKSRRTSRSRGLPSSRPCRGRTGQSCRPPRWCARISAACSRARAQSAPVPERRWRWGE